ncbi:hypothetical protein [Cecembia rubra]|uniref:Cytochrome c oxidase subunit IV n=1 Tax=Cecembia rubra TaxID=1485585 RepID=A0A2P8EEA4_9BACT|nr:hypothetical protein [Cecembia rubra]PSL07773.1 hypothetical protein CLV48_101711 [Cecembia rubra]
MEKKNLSILFILIGLTLVMALLDVFNLEIGNYLTSMVMGIAAVKFLLVAFAFMDLRKAHFFWKFATVLIGLLIVLVVGFWV